MNKGMIKALGQVLKLNDVRMLAVALEGIDNTLKNGQEFHRNEQGENKFTIVFEQEGCLDDLENLQTHPNHTIYQQALKIIDKYFPSDEDDPIVNMINNAQQNRTDDPP